MLSLSIWIQVIARPFSINFSYQLYLTEEKNGLHINLSSKYGRNKQCPTLQYPASVTLMLITKSICDQAHHIHTTVHTVNPQGEGKKKKRKRTETLCTGKTLELTRSHQKRHISSDSTSRPRQTLRKPSVELRRPNKTTASVYGGTRTLTAEIAPCWKEE